MSAGYAYPSQQFSNDNFAQPQIPASGDTATFNTGGLATHQPNITQQQQPQPMERAFKTKASDAFLYQPSKNDTSCLFGAAASPISSATSVSHNPSTSSDSVASDPLYMNSPSTQPSLSALSSGFFIPPELQIVPDDIDISFLDQTIRVESDEMNSNMSGNVGMDLDANPNLHLNVANPTREISQASQTQTRQETQKEPDPQVLVTYEPSAVAKLPEDVHVPVHPEVMYATTPSGTIVSVEDELWDKFIGDNVCMPFPQRIIACKSDNIVGRSLFDFIGDLKLQSFYRHIMYVVLNGIQPRFSFHWFCDGPDVERKMRMSVGRMRNIDKSYVVLWCSQILYEKKLNPPASYLTADLIEPNKRTHIPSNKIFRTVCSYCKRIQIHPSEVSYISTHHPYYKSKLLPSSLHLPVPFMDPENQDVPIIGLRGKMGQTVETTSPTSSSSSPSPTTSSAPQTTIYTDDPHHFSKFTEPVWLNPHQYYTIFPESSDSKLIIHHGICNVCHEEIMGLFCKQYPGMAPVPMSREEALTKNT
ncbi:hypothetical protein BKA69DRAFT_1039164 [Paraphysoderma sedebokerense]|nr:hypothetical protein BKA69DRAFT_1039164 [Paraphysoderma sedebokerense]